MRYSDERVYLCAVDDYDSPQLSQAIEEFFEASPLIGALTAQSRVLLKPNLLAKHAPQRAVTTHPAVVRAVIRALKKRGVRNMTVADSPGGVYHAGIMKAIYRQSGLQQVCDEEGVLLYSACHFAQKVSDSGVLVRSFMWIEPALEADLIINLPKVKTHVMMGMSCAVKNLFGLVPGLQKAELHMRFPQKEHFGAMLVDLCTAVGPCVTVADGILAMEGDGPAGGEPRRLGLLLAGENPFALDLAVCHIMNFAPQRVEYLAQAMQRGLCSDRVDAAQVWGQAQQLFARTDYRMPESYLNINFTGKRTRAIQWLLAWSERNLAPRPVIRRAACIGCGKCAEICPGKTIRLRDGRASILPKGCIRCFCCHEMCPVKAIDMKRFFIFGK